MMQGRDAHETWKWLLAAALMLALIPAAARAAPDLPPGVRLVDGYIPRFEQKRRMEGAYGGTVEGYRQEILRRGAAGENLPCSSQILEEADWLVGSTGDVARVERRLENLRESLQRTPAEQAEFGMQSATDGSWGGCYEAWFLRMHASVDPLAMVGAGLFMAGWGVAQVTNTGSLTIPSLVADAAAQSNQSAAEATLYALLYGVATVAVDAEATAMRVNELSDRHRALEGRIAALEAHTRR